MAISSHAMLMSASSISQPPPAAAAVMLSSSNSSLFSSSKTFKSLNQVAVEKNRSSKKRGGGLSCNCMFGLGMPELVVIAGVATLVFGPKKLPEVGKTIGKTFKSFQQAAKEFETELKRDQPESLENSKPAVIEQENQDSKSTQVSL